MLYGLLMLFSGVAGAVLLLGLLGRVRLRTTECVVLPLLIIGSTVGMAWLNLQAAG